MIPTTQRQKIAANYHEILLPHWKAEIQTTTWHQLLFIGVMVGQPAVTEIEGRPEKVIGANGKAYVPHLRIGTLAENCYVHVATQSTIETTRPHLEPLISAFASKRQASFRLVTHEWIDARAFTAWFWLKASRWAMQYGEHSLSREREVIKRTIEQTGEASLEELISHHDHLAPSKLVGAICKLLCEHVLACPNSNKPLDGHSRFVLAPLKRPDSLPEMGAKP